MAQYIKFMQNESTTPNDLKITGFTIQSIQDESTYRRAATPDTIKFFSHL